MKGYLQLDPKSLKEINSEKSVAVVAEEYGKWENSDIVWFPTSSVKRKKGKVMVSTRKITDTYI